MALSALLPAAALAGAACTGYEGIHFCADLNQDCKVTASDALSTLKIAVGQGSDVVESDLDGSGVTTASDALKVLKVAVGSTPATLSCGDQVGIFASAAGFYNQDGVGSPNGYAVGWYAGSSAELRDYLIFDLSGVTRTITAAKLHLRTAPDAQPPYQSQDPSETYTLFDIATAPAVLTAGTGGTAAFADLGEGTVYGSLVATPAIGHIADVPMNAAGVAWLNSQSGTVAIGGAYTTLSKGATNEYLFNATSVTNTRHLILTVE